jgi:hypothetical protein
LQRDGPDRALTVTLASADPSTFIMYSPYESRYFHDLVVTLFTRSDTLPRYVQHLSQIHSILAMVCAGLGLAIVPEAATNLNFRGVELRALRLQGAPPVETDPVWRRDDESPLLPSLIEIAGGYAVSIIKAGMKVIGRDSGPVRPPLTDLTDNELAELTALVAQLPRIDANGQIAAE